MTTDYKYKNLILSGGGTKGIACLGSLKYLEEINILKNIESFACTSVGSIIAFLLIIGYKPEELFQFINILNVNKLIKFNFEQFFDLFGTDDTKKIINIVIKLGDAKKISSSITFKELFEKTNKKLIITGVCINTKTIEYFDYINTPDMIVLDAIKISISIPFIFIPVSYNNKLYVDGGIMDNYPIHLFNKELETTLGICLANSRDHVEKCDDIFNYFMNVFSCVLEGISIMSFRNYEKNTILLKLEGDLIMKNESKETMYKFGYSETQKFFASI